MSVQQRRLAKACMLIGAGFLILALWNPVARGVGVEQGQTPSFSGAAFMGEVLFAAQEEESDAGAAQLEALDAGVRRSPVEAPAWFQDEVLPLEAVGDLRAVDDWSVVGFTLDKDKTSGLVWMEEQLEKRCWSLVESGVDGTLTGTKEGGRLSWLLCSCTEVGDQTCVVVQVPAA